MNAIALKMLIGNRGKFFGIVLGLTFASLLITQQSAIFVGLMSRTYAAISDMGLPDIWVMDPMVQFIDDIKPLQDTELFRVRGVDGVGWAVPLYKGLLRARLENGNFQTCNVIGLDDTSLIGGPATMIEGQLSDLRRSEGVIVDIVGASDKLAKPGVDGKPVPLKPGNTLELNDHRAVVVGLCSVSRTFQSQPVIYTTYSRATQFAPKERRLLSFILVKPKEGEDRSVLCQRIQNLTGLKAYTRDEFKQLTVQYFLKRTGIPVNFGIAVVLGFIVGTAIAGQTFLSFTLDNLRHFGTLKAMGLSDGTLLRMVLLQAMWVGIIGYGLGVGAASFSGYMLRYTELSFKLPWQLLVLSAASVTLIVVISASFSVLKVMRLEPAIVFKGE